MRKAILLGAVAVVLMVGASPAWADLDEKDIAKIAKLRSENKKFTEALGQYPEPQTLWFGSGAAIYMIDFRTQLCFAGGTQSPTLLSCKIIKKGYPLIAPLITWDD